MESAGSRFEWTDYYIELASKLLVFKNARKELLNKLQNAYAQNNVHFPTLEDGEPFDIDPFTVFGMFNKGLADETRTTIASGIKDEFELQSPAPTDFTGIPTLNNFSATFYAFKNDRGVHDIDNLWNVFEKALALANNDTKTVRGEFISAYDKAAPQKQVKWNLTMGLYWIRPFTFLNLDSRSRWFLDDMKNAGEAVAAMVHSLKGSLPDARTYLSLKDKISEVFATGKTPFNNFPELSVAAWNISQQVNEEKKGKNPPQNVGSISLGDKGVESTHYWICAPGTGATQWDEFYDEGIIAIGWGQIGDITQFGNKEQIAQALKGMYGGDGSRRNDALALWQFTREMKPGDIIFVKRGKSQIIGRGVVKSDYRYEEKPTKYRNIRDVNWTHRGEWTYPKGQAPLKTLTDITSYTDNVAKLNALFEGEEEIDEPTPIYQPYTKEDFLSEVYLDEREYDRLVSLMRNKKNVILQGAPGVGKTFAAKRLAYSIMGMKDTSRVELIQFHQSYSYEDFIMGFRPSETGFELRTGSFYEFCKKAEEDSDRDYFFIIDEINRGNLSKIFGELFMLLEADKRGASLKLLYSDEQFCIPPNVYLLGMMNTADRSLALLDYALRRRFAFYEMEPGFESQGFREYRHSLESQEFDSLIRCVQQLNAEIESDESLGRGFRIGHSYFCGLDSIEPGRLEEIVEYELVPLIQEYWFDEPGKISDWTARLQDSIK